jgi:glycosyltransferase involved in cell wall biosynthesis
MKITATVITFNEEKNLAEALESLAWADEIVVVDSQSTDRTVEIARQFTDKIWVRPWPGYSAQKNFASEQASHDWIFNLDADERVSSELATEIDEIKRSAEPRVRGYVVRRRTRYLGRWIKHSGWYPDQKLRLFDRRAGRWRGSYVHESVAVDGAVGSLTGEIIHHTVENVAEHHSRIDRYTTLAAEEMYVAGKKASLKSLLFSPPVAFLRSYFVRLGFLDGLPGLAIAYFAADYVFLKTLKLWELQTGRGSR